MKYTVKYRKWWYRLVPSKRQELRIMQFMVDRIAEKPEVQREINKKVIHWMLYGRAK